MELTQNHVIAVAIVLLVLWVWLTWNRSEGFVIRIPQGMPWGEYVYYEDENFPVADPSIVTNYDLYKCRN